jgi:hypothetical protein
MIAIPSQTYIDSTLRIGSVYKLSAPEHIDTTIPHYFVVVAIDEDDNHLVLCTTQREKKEEYFKNAGYDLTSLVYIRNDTDNGLTEETWVNCNDTYPISRADLIRKRDEGILIWVGQISYNHYDQLRTGIKSSYINDLPHELLIHPED